MADVLNGDRSVGVGELQSHVFGLRFWAGARLCCALMSALEVQVAGSVRRCGTRLASTLDYAPLLWQHDVHSVSACSCADLLHRCAQDFRLASTIDDASLLTAVLCAHVFVISLPIIVTLKRFTTWSQVFKVNLGIGYARSMLLRSAARSRVSSCSHVPAFDHRSPCASPLFLYSSGRSSVRLCVRLLARILTRARSHTPCFDLSSLR